MDITTFGNPTVLWPLVTVLLVVCTQIFVIRLIDSFSRIRQPQKPKSAQRNTLIRPAPRSLIVIQRRAVQSPQDRIVQDETGAEINSEPALNTVELGGLVSAATCIGGKDRNEDRFYYEEMGQAKFVIIADGVSSTDHGDLAAQQVMESLRFAIHKNLEKPASVFTPTFFREACTQAVRRIAQQIPSEGTAESTFVVLLELPDRVVLAYLGDGGAVWARGNQRDGRSLLLAQHDEYGRLSGYVSATGVVGTPTVIQIQKSAESDGAIFAIGSDGALPRGQEIRRMSELLTTLSQAVKDGNVKLTSAEVAQIIERSLESWKPDDNATLGLIFTGPALTYWRQQAVASDASQPGGNHDDGNAVRALAVAGR